MGKAAARRGPRATREDPDLERDAPAAQPLLIIAGPTAVGKSAVALEVAGRLGAEILSADSMQVYRGLAVGTAQPSTEDLARVPHHLVGHVDPGEEYHVGRFVREAEGLLATGRRFLAVGGTGLFLKHLVEGLLPDAPRDAELRARLMAELARVGADAMRDRLRLVDPAREAQINANDSVRVVRALEVFELTGRPMSELMAEHRASLRPRPAVYCVLTRERAELNARIDARVDAMLGAGWLEEARWLLGLGLPENDQACKALGYRELFAVVRGESTLGEARAAIKHQTRRFAKRQMTWFRGVKEARWFDAGRADVAGAIIDAGREAGLG